jgi:hypothetical protein
MTKINLLLTNIVREWPKVLPQSIRNIDGRIRGIITLVLAALSLIAIRMLRHTPASSLKPKSDPIAVVQPAITPAVLPTPFGAAEWKKYIGDVGVEPPLPSDIEEILSAPCPFWLGKTVRDTHLLVLIPKTVNGQPLKLKLLEELVKKPLQGHPIKYGLFDMSQYSDPVALKSHWVLMTREVLEGSLNQPLAQQQALIEAAPGYEVPTILDATVCISMEIISTGKTCYSQKPQIFTRCQEKNNHQDQQLIVGNGSSDVVAIGDYSKDFGRASIGIGCLRKL